MAYYLTTAACIERFGQASIEQMLDKDEAEALTELALIINRNESLIHSYIQTKYTVPITAEDALPLLEEWMLGLVQYDMHQRMEGPSVQERVRQEYMDVIWQLKGVQKGEVTLPGTSGATTQTGSFATDSNDIQFDWGGDAEGSF